MMRILWLLALALAAAAGDPLLAQAPAAVQTAPASLPSAADVLERYRKAIGGTAAVRRHQSRRMVGRFELSAQAISGPLEILAAAPDRILVRMELGGLGRVERGFDGAVGWSIDPGVGPRLLQGRELDELKHSAEFYSELKDPSRFESVTLVERAPFEGKDCYVMKLVRPSGIEVTEYYEVSSGLLAGSRMTSTSAMGSVPTVVVVDEYKTFDDVLMPTRVRQRAMGVEFLLTTTSVEHNQVPPDAFVPPAEIAGLLPGPR